MHVFGRERPAGAAEPAAMGFGQGSRRERDLFVDPKTYPKFKSLRLKPPTPLEHS